MTTTNKSQDQYPELGAHKDRTYRIITHQHDDPDLKLRQGLKKWREFFDKWGVRNGSSLRSEQERVARESIEAILALDLENLKPGDQIYIPSSFHTSLTDYNLLGGLATVSKIEGDRIWVEEDPRATYLVHALRHQAVMKAVFGEQRARAWTDEDTREVQENQPVIPEGHPRRTWARKAYEAIFRKTGIGKKITDNPPISIRTFHRGGKPKQQDANDSQNQ